MAEVQPTVIVDIESATIFSIIVIRELNILCLMTYVNANAKVFYINYITDVPIHRACFQKQEDANAIFLFDYGNNLITHFMVCAQHLTVSNVLTIVQHVPVIIGMNYAINATAGPDVYEWFTYNEGTIIKIGQEARNVYRKDNVYFTITKSGLVNICTHVETQHNLGAPKLLIRYDDEGNDLVENNFPFAPDQLEPCFETEPVISIVHHRGSLYTLINDVPHYFAQIGEEVHVIDFEGVTAYCILG